MPCAHQDVFFFLLSSASLSVDRFGKHTHPRNTPDRLCLPARALKGGAEREKRENGQAQISALVGLRQSADAPSMNPDSLVLDPVLLTNS